MPPACFSFWEALTPALFFPAMRLWIPAPTCCPPTPHPPRHSSVSSFAPVPSTGPGSEGAG